MTNEMTLGEQIVRRFEKMKASRANWDSHWLEIAKLVLPRKDDVFTTSKFMVGGEKKTNTLFDASAVHANELLASALHSMLTNPTTTWFDYSTGDADLDKHDKVRLWLQKATQQTHQVLNQSNFQTEIHETYLDLGSFGTSLMFIEEDKENIVRFQSRPIYESHIDENEKGSVDTVYRCFKWNLRKIIQKWGEGVLDDDLLRMAKKDPDKEFSIIHAVFPRNSFDIKKLNKKNKKIASVYILEEKRLTLEESGFNEFPYLVPRWTKISGEMYGRSPSMKALPDIKMINEMMKVHIRSAQKVVDPPLLVDDDGVLLPIRTFPGSINYKRAGTKGVIEPLLTGGRLDISFEMMRDLRNRIQEAFFIDQLQLNEGPQMTATEVAQRTEEKLRLLAPILARQHFELLRPLIDRVFGIMLRKNMFDEAPEILRGKNIQVRYSSQVAKAQRLTDSTSLIRAMEIISPVIQTQPNVIDNIDGDEAVVEVFKMFGVPQEILRDAQEVQDMRDARVEAQQQAAENAQELDDAEKISKVSGATE